MMFVLILSFVTRNIINYPLMWIIEMAQFTITAYYLLGGGYSMITDDHVRMDLFYGRLSKRKSKNGCFYKYFFNFLFNNFILWFNNKLDIQLKLNKNFLRRGQELCLAN